MHILQSNVTERMHSRNRALLTITTSFPLSTFLRIVTRDIQVIWFFFSSHQALVATMLENPLAVVGRYLIRRYVRVLMRPHRN